MRPSRDNTADAVVSMSRSSNDEAMPDWVAGCWVAGDGLLEMGSSQGFPGVVVCEVERVLRPCDSPGSR